MIVCIIKPCTDGSDVLGVSFWKSVKFSPYLHEKSVKSIWEILAGTLVIANLRSRI